jgi:uncharacterized membrane protein YphA (DoxX/SURF4 family)
MIVLRRFAFRLLVSYLAVYLTLNWLIEHLDGLADLGLAPGAQPLLNAYAATWARAVIWTGQHVFRVGGKLTYFAGGNSDGLFSFVQLGCFAIAAMRAATTWTLFDRRQFDDARIGASLRTVLRYALAATLLGYGMIKVIPTQFFGLPSLADLVKPYGNLSPFEVLWTFMGSSSAYTIFTGVIEVAAGLLLLFRRTTTLGALVAAGALVNVAALDFSYGVPEKLDVLHLIVFAVIVLAPDIPRLADAIVLNRPVAAVAVTVRVRHQRSAGWNLATIAIVTYMLVTSALTPFRIREQYPPHGPLYGVYNVVTFESNGRIIEPLTTDTVRWRRVVFVDVESTWVELMDDSWRRYQTSYEPSSGVVTLTTGPNGAPAALRYDRAAGQVELHGMIEDATICVDLARVDESQFRLLKSRFRWINGEP